MNDRTNAWRSLPTPYLLVQHCQVPGLFLGARRLVSKAEKGSALAPLMEMEFSDIVLRPRASQAKTQEDPVGIHEGRSVPEAVMAATMFANRTEKVARSQITMVRSMYHVPSEKKM